MARGVIAACRDLVDGERGGGGEDAVDGEDHPCGERRVDAEELEDCGDEQREERWYPGGGAGVAEEGVSITVAGDQSAGYAAGLPAKLEVVKQKADAVGVGEGDVEQADGEAKPEDACWGSETGSGVGEEGLQAGKHSESIVSGRKPRLKGVEPPGDSGGSTWLAMG